MPSCFFVFFVFFFYYYVYYTVPCCFFFFFGLFCLRFSYHHSLKNWSLKWECGWSWLDEHCSFASSTVCIDCGFALFSFYRCHCVPLFVHAERINYWLTDWLIAIFTANVVHYAKYPERNVLKTGRAYLFLSRYVLSVLVVDKKRLWTAASWPSRFIFALPYSLCVL